MKEVEEDRFKHWDTEPVKVKQAYTPETYTALEWKLRTDIERLGVDEWDKSMYESDLTRLEI